MTVELARLSVSAAVDVFSARLTARQAAVELGFEATDQVRVASAVSELGRLIVAARARGVVSIAGEIGAERLLSISVSTRRTPALAEPLDVAIRATSQLMDDVVVPADGPVQVTMSKALPPGRGPYSDTELEAIHTRLIAQRGTSPLEDLRAQNAELLRTLEELNAKQDELVRLNAELTETNSGVMAMYSQLSSELEETNRGVVALYAELDERGAQLRDASAAKSRFLASVSHELRSPLNSVRALAGLLREPDSDPLTEAQERQVALIESSSRELLGLVNDLLDLAKAESGSLHPAAARVNLAAMLAELRATMRPMTPAGVELVIDADPALPDVNTDATLLAHLLRNLISNALKFTESGQVRVTASMADDVLTASVSDSGIGIAPEHQQLIFEEFYQIPGPLQRRSRSTGLGLPYARRIAQVFGGSLTVDSKLGAGSTFTATLPMPVLPEHGEHGSDVSFGTVLVVDDDPAARHALRDLLADIADRVVDADAADTALHVMRLLHPDLVLLDLHMPTGGGERVLEEAAQGELAHIPIAVVTSLDIDGALLRRTARAFATVSKSQLTRQSLADTLRLATPEHAP